jgi:small subunit ribosomal protein S2
MTFQPTFTIKELLDAGVHFGHKTMRWNPKMAPFLYGSRDNIHIIDLQQTVPLLYRALHCVYNVVKNNGRVLFVGTKKQASEELAESAKRCGQYYVNHRWLGGMLTNWPTISKSINTLRSLEQQLSGSESNSVAFAKLTKKEILEITRQKDKLDRSLGGIRDMGGKPDLLFIIDTNKESLAIKEALKLNIPIVAILDSNSNPDDINYPVPGNDDASRSIKLYCRLISDAALAGIQDSLASSGADIGASADVASEGDYGKKNEVRPIRSKKTMTPIAKKPAATVTNKKPKAAAIKKESDASVTEDKDSSAGSA